MTNFEPCFLNNSLFRSVRPWLVQINCWDLSEFEILLSQNEVSLKRGSVWFIGTGVTIFFCFKSF